MKHSLRHKLAGAQLKTSLLHDSGSSMHTSQKKKLKSHPTTDPATYIHDVPERYMGVIVSRMLYMYLNMFWLDLRLIHELETVPDTAKLAKVLRVDGSHTLE